MPVHTSDKVKTTEDALARKLAEKATSLEPAALRQLKKKLRRAQRKRRRLVQFAERLAGKAKTTAEEASA